MHPFVMFGHNRRAAFSSTAGIDNIEDIYAEKLNPENPRQYWYKNSWRDMAVRSHSFKVKDKSGPVIKEEMYTVHGPVFFVDNDHNVNEYLLETAMDFFHPVTVLGYFLYQPITSSIGSLPTFPKVDRGTENHIVDLELGAIKGVNITAPGTSGLISQSGNKSKNLGDQVNLFVDFNYKPILFYRESVERSAQATVEIELK